MANVFRRGKSGRLTSGSLYKKRKGDNVQLIADDFFEASSGVTEFKVWDGSAWVVKPTKVWNGSAWVTKPVKQWSGSAWV